MRRALEAIAVVAIATLLSPASRGQEKAFEIRGSVVAGSQPLARVDVSLRARTLRLFYSQNAHCPHLRVAQAYWLSRDDS
jgi:hypothetical protein